MNFYLGTHQVNWLARPEFASVPLFVSARWRERVLKAAAGGVRQPCLFS